MNKGDPVSAMSRFQQRKYNVYVIQAEGGPVKVGIAVDPQKRLAALRTGTPFRLSLAHVEPIADDMRATIIERTAHALLSVAHAHGEWFNVSAEEATAAVQQAVEDVGRQASKTATAANNIDVIPSINPKLNTEWFLITGHQIRMARKSLRWSVKDLAEASGVSAATIKRMEESGGVPRCIADKLLKVQTTIENHGFALVRENGGGAGLRMRKPVGDMAPQD